VVAFAAATAEIVLPALLVLGLGTRFAALGLLVMTAVVQLTVPSGWPVHLTWAAMALGLMAGGPGRLSLDAAVARGRTLRPGW
jgi:putative oxidoreductase